MDNKPIIAPPCIPVDSDQVNGTPGDLTQNHAPMSIDQAIEAAIRKATGQDSMPQQNQRGNARHAILSKSPPQSHLPQDIMHILDSDFTTDNADVTRQVELVRITEELRLKVRLSRCQRARDETSDSQKSDSDSDDSDSDSDQTGDHQSLKVEDQVDDPDVDGSGDEEAERVKNINLLKTIKTEIDRACATNSTTNASLLQEGDSMEDQKLENSCGIKPESQPSSILPSDSMVPRILENSSVLQSECEPSAKGFIVPSESVEPRTTQRSSGSPLECGQSTEDSTVVPSESVSQLEHTSASPLNQAIPRSQAQNDQSRPSETDNILVRDSVNLVVANKGPARKACKRKPQSRTAVDEEEDSDLESDSYDFRAANKIGPTTEHELKEVPASIFELPFDMVTGSDLKTIKRFGVINSLIDNIVVIKGDSQMGYETVLDEGSMVCWQDGTLIGRIFETFGAVTEPHYSIRLPSRLQEMSKTPPESSRFTPSTPVYFLPSQSTFLFTSQIRAQPKGTDASNFYDEEVNGDEIEFSDDEAEAAYIRSCKMARKTAAMGKRQQGKSAMNESQINTSAPLDPGLSISAGTNMFDKRPSNALNYNDEDDDGAHSDYFILERPKLGLDSSVPPNCFSGPTSTSRLKSNGHSARQSNPRSTDSRARSDRARFKGRGGRGTIRRGRANATLGSNEFLPNSARNGYDAPENLPHDRISGDKLGDRPTTSLVAWQNNTSASSASFPPSTSFHFQPFTSSGSQHSPQQFGGTAGFNTTTPTYNPLRPNLIGFPAGSAFVPPNPSNPNGFTFPPPFFNSSGSSEYLLNLSGQPKSQMVSYPSYPAMLPQQQFQAQNVFQQSQVSNFSPQSTSSETFPSAWINGYPSPMNHQPYFDGLMTSNQTPSSSFPMAVVSHQHLPTQQALSRSGIPRPAEHQNGGYNHSRLDR